MARLTHLDRTGAANMVDVSDKDVTARTALAEGRVVMAVDTVRLIREGDAEIEAAAGETRLDEVVLADRGAAERHENVEGGAFGRGERPVEVLRRVAGDAEIDRRTARLRRHAGEREHVGGDDLVRPDRLAGQDQLVAGGEHAHMRPRPHLQAGMAHGGGERQPRRVEPLARPQQHLALAKVEPRRADEGARLHRGRDRDRVALRLRVLLDDDRVGAGRHRRAGEDAHRLARPEGEAGAASGDALAGDAQAARRVLAAHRPAVHGGSRKGRLRAERGEVGGERATGALGERDLLGRNGARHRGEDAGERLRDRQEAHGASQSPERPPLLRRSRTPSMRMPRSAALTMS